MEEFSFEPQDVRKSTKPIVDEKKKGATLSLIDVYLWLALGLLISGVVSLGFPNLIILLAVNVDASLLVTIYMVVFVLSIIFLLISGVVCRIQAFRKNLPLIITSYVIYSISMGVLLSNIFLLYVGPGEGIGTIGLAFFVTGAAFLLCGLFGALTKKKNLSFLIPILMSVLMGALVISLVNFFFQSPLLYWVFDFAFLGALLLEVVLDFHSVYKIAESGTFEKSKNLAIFCAFTLYSDFIYLFIRFLLIILSSKRKK